MRSETPGPFQYEGGQHKKAQRLDESARNTLNAEPLPYGWLLIPIFAFGALGLVVSALASAYRFLALVRRAWRHYSE